MLWFSPTRYSLAPMAVFLKLYKELVLVSLELPSKTLLP